MKGVELAKQRLLQFAESPWGVGRYDINSRIDRVRRADARIALEDMIASGKLHPAQGWRRDGVTWFSTAEAAAAWIAAGRPMRPNCKTHEPWQPRPKIAPKPVPVKPLKAAKPAPAAARVIDHTPARPSPRAVQCPNLLDERYSVRALAAGYQSVLNANECRGWAKAVAR